MTDIHDDLTEFLERRLADRGDRDDIPEREILDALRVGSTRLSPSGHQRYL
jgi:hypothetical protein